MPQETCSSNYTFLTESGLLSTHCPFISNVREKEIIPFLVYMAKKLDILLKVLSEA
ncbi:MAG: hypothetical protein ACFFA5_08840 [Promethearchaeota archaeon]